MLREEWSVKRTGADIARGAEEQRTFREERLKAWEEKKAAVMQKVRESGLTVHEDIAEEMYKLSNVTRGMGASIVVDHTLQADLNRCIQKINEHRQKIKEYEAWIPLLRSSPGEWFELDHEDWVYFFGKY